MRYAPALVLIFLLAGCAARAPLADHDAYWSHDGTARPNGAIYQEGREIALFENATARHIGDIVTVRLMESTNAAKSATTTTARSTEATLSGPTVFGRPVTVNGTEVLSGSASNETQFDGSAGSKQSNSLAGNITVTVVKRYPNGNLLVRGEKWIEINQGREFIRLEGVIRPVDIEPDNSIPSYKIANARIAYGGKGALADANRPGLLARFFNSPWLPF